MGSKIKMSKKNASSKKHEKPTIDIKQQKSATIQPSSQELSLKDAPTISVGIDVGEALAFNKQPVAPPEIFIDNLMNNAANEQPINQDASNKFSYGSDEKINSFLRMKKTDIDKKLSQYKQVYNIYKSAGNFNRDTAISVAVRLSNVYSLPIVFDNTNGLFIFWNATTKTHTTLDIFGGFGVTSIAGISQRNKFANNFNFSTWALNIYNPLVSSLEAQMETLNSMSNGETYDAISKILCENTQVINTIIELLKGKK